ncbi:3,4-dihydroxy-2-butanone-4-phosphate synthase [Shewanella sp. 202IG2-18]|uniref:3,4-dihydroxy-2-butanone-4-phosphate synthase n=1 Tax=Parashewanella hymeniacidonis TaxID=2807618 RepID=UPI00195FD901|nr:3,4-dihydroxy-2-butanone-4-phosphate synthase [Parashewanella hymeniacidonis]MBM7071723.1 3,4-dihydroxy-2-butanone-4-phosphate synthase [Parashewanella hymeniacidonis]
MDQSNPTIAAISRVNHALEALQQGCGVLLMDNEARENEADVIFSAQTLTTSQMAQLIRDCSGIVCLCLTGARINQLQIPMMVENNTSQYGTAFTISIEAAYGVTTGVSAVDRVSTVKAAINELAKPSDLARPGHVYPLRAHLQGVLGRGGHTEGTIDLMTLAGLKPAGVLCELMNPDGTMAKGKQVERYSQQHDMPMLWIDDIIAYRLQGEQQAS